MQHFTAWGYKGFNLAARLPGGAWLLGRKPLRSLRNQVYLRHVRGMPDRVYMNETIIPALLESGFSRVLSVGCAEYTQEVPGRFERRGIECWTTDISPEEAQWGNPERHLVGDVSGLANHFPASHFDAILFSGVMGYGVNAEHMPPIIEGFHRLLRPGGLLVAGWNVGLAVDPLTLACVTHRFEHAPALSMPARKAVEKSTHVYDLFLRRD